MRHIFAALVLVLGVGCANPSITNVSSHTLPPNRSGSVYVARFEGETDFADEATDMFVATLEEYIERPVIQGDSVRAESTDISGSGNIAPQGPALAQAKRAGAKWLVLGKVTSHETSGMMNGFTTVRVFHVATARRVATIHRPSGKLFAYSVHQCVMASAESAAESAAEEVFLEES